jgi:EmrB/QacA subfamily drug resistance transporter
MVNVALPDLADQLDATTGQLQWVVDAYNLVFAALLLTAGSLSDRFGRKGMLLTGLAVFGVSSVVGGFVTSPGLLISTRAVMGLGAAMTFPATLSLISNVFTERTERARAIGLWGATAGVAVAVGPIAGGWLLGHFSWSSIFFAMGPVAAIAILMVALNVPTSRDREATGTDYGGLLLSTAFMGLLVYTIIEAPTEGWTSGRSVAGFVASALCFAGFLLYERRSARPMLDVRLFRNMRFSAASGSVTIAFFTLFGFIFLMVQYFQVIRSYSPLSTGVHLLPVALALAVGSIAGTQLAVRTGTKAVVTAGLIAMTAFYVWVAASLSATLDYDIIALQMVLYGLGMGLTSAPATESIMGAISLRQAGVGSAVNDATRLLGGTLGVAVIGSVYASLYRTRLTDDLPTGLPHALTATAHHSVGAAFTAAGTAQASGHLARAAAIQQAATHAFIHGLQAGCLVAGGVAAGGVLLAALFLPSQPTAPISNPTSPSMSPLQITR